MMQQLVTISAPLGYEDRRSSLSSQAQAPCRTNGQAFKVSPLAGLISMPFTLSFLSTFRMSSILYVSPSRYCPIPCFICLSCENRITTSLVINLLSLNQLLDFSIIPLCLFITVQRVLLSQPSMIYVPSLGASQEIVQIAMLPLLSLFANAISFFSENWFYCKELRLYFYNVCASASQSQVCS